MNRLNAIKIGCMKQINLWKNILIPCMILITIISCSEKEVEQPEIIAVEPVRGLIGDPVVIKGLNLNNASSISFNGASSLILNNTSTEVSTVIPSNAKLGINSIVVLTKGGASNELQFEVVPEPDNIDPFPPVIEKTIPASSHIDYPVLIYGKFLSGVISITFNDIEAIIFTNNQRVITTTVPKGVPNGLATIKIRTVKGISTIDFNVQGPPPNGVIPVNFSIMNIPPPTYIPIISNAWSCGVFDQISDSTFVDFGSENDDNTFNVIGKFEYHFDESKGYNEQNYVEITNKQTGEVFAGQFSSELDNPCIYRMVLISSLTGEVFECTVDASGDFPDCNK
jgi:hypothetical protein